MRGRRLHKRPAQLEITAFLNLIVVLVPFLLSTAVFSRLAVLDLTLPASQSSGAENLKENDLKLEIVIRPEALVVQDRIGGKIEDIPNIESGYDVHALAEEMSRLKAQFPNTTEASILSEPDTPYDVLVKVMDAVREGHLVQGNNVVHGELFPDISIGDAPIRNTRAGS